MIDAYQAVLAARSYRSSAGTKAGHAVLVSATQLNAVGRRSARERFTETVTNAGRGPVTVHLAGRTLSPYATITSRTVSTPPVPGDRSGAIVLRTSAAPKLAGGSGASSPRARAARQSTIPVTLRSVAPSSGTFSGTLTGGNGRDFNSGQVAYYEIGVRPGRPALNAAISGLPSSDQVLTELVSPTGLVESAAANTLMIAGSSGGPPKPVAQLGAELHVLRPAAGNWTLIADFVNPVSGTAVAAPFTVSVDDKAGTATQTGLPTSAAVKLAAHLTVTNDSALPQQYFVDARRNSRAWVALAPQGPAKLSQPDLQGAGPEFLVPSDTSALAAQVAAPARNFFDLSWTFGDPDVISSTGKTSVAALDARLVPDGLWVATPYRVGPDRKQPTKPVLAHVSMRALIAPFDSSITSLAGDLWRRSTDRKAAVDPRLAKPGQKITIAVTIDPKGAPGTVDSGTITVAAP